MFGGLKRGIWGRLKSPSSETKYEKGIEYRGKDIGDTAVSRCGSKGLAVVNRAGCQ